MSGLKKILFFVLAIYINTGISYSQTNFNKIARDYIKSSLIINYYSEDRPLFEKIDLYSNKIFPKIGYKYEIEIRPFANSYSNSINNVNLYEYNFEFSYTSDSSIWNSNFGVTSNSFSHVLKVYKNKIINPVELYEVNLLHMKGLIAETTDGVIFMVNRSNNYNLDINTLSKKNFEINNLKEVISFRYFHYSPEKIHINVEFSSFSFYSATLERFFNGKLRYNNVKMSYSFELEEGVLLGD